MPTQTQNEVHANLTSPEGKIPLKGVMIEGHISGTHSRITVKQRYRNEEEKSLEAVYTFPLQENSAVCGFSAKIGDRVIEGSVDEKEKAFETYDDAMSEGHGAFLLDQERPNIFTASVGNLKPNTEVEVSITYVSPLTFEDKALRVMIPTTISPRFVPYNPVEVGQPDSEKINPPSQESVPYGFNLNLTVEMGSEITEIVSPSHKISSEIEGKNALLSLDQDKDADMDRDLVILVESKDPHKPYAVVGVEEDGTRVAMLTFFPDPERTVDTGREIIFVVDCSGSMSGTSIQEAKRALGLCIRGLSKGDGFNIIQFGSQHKSLWEGPKDFTEESLQEASSWLDRMNASMGGTNIYPPMLEAVSGPYDEEKVRQVLLFTDGQVSNEDDVIALCKLNVKNVRVFTFGIGSGCSEYLIKGAARAGKGASEFIFPGERIEPKVLRMFKRIATPSYPSVEVDWKGMKVDQAPLETPPIFSGDSFTVFGRIRYGAAMEATLKAGEEEWTIPLDLEITAENSKFLPVFWAKHRIQDLEDGRRAKYGSQQADRHIKLREKQLTELGIKYSLATSMTSFVAIEKREEGDKSTGEVQLRKVPIALTNGWGGHDSVTESAGGQGMTMSFNATASGDTRLFYHSAASAGPPVRKRMSRGTRSRSFSAQGHNSYLIDALEERSSGGVLECSRGGNEHFNLYQKGTLGIEEIKSALDIHAEVPVDDRGKIYAVLLTQKADGSFSWTPELNALLGSDLAMEVQKEVEKHGEELVSTISIISFLEQKMDQFKDEWDLAIKKAKKWLEGSPNVDQVHISI